MSNPEYLDKTGLDELVSQTKSYVGNKVSKKIDKPVNVLPGKVLQTDSHGDPIWGEAVPQADIVQAVDDWLEENIDPGSAITLDPTLTQAQAAAQAKAVGDKIDSLKENLIVVDDDEPESDDNVIWVPETPENEVVVPTISELNEVAGTVAKDYADLTFPVKAGTLCRHEYGLYAAKQDIPTQEAWTSGHWSTKTNIADKLDSLSSAFNSEILSWDIAIFSDTSWGQGGYKTADGSAASNAKRIRTSLFTLDTSNGIRVVVPNAMKAMVFIYSNNSSNTYEGYREWQTGEFFVLGVDKKYKLVAAYTDDTTSILPAAGVDIQAYALSGTDKTLTMEGKAADAKITGDFFEGEIAYAGVPETWTNTWEQGGINSSNGTQSISTTRIRFYSYMQIGFELKVSVPNGMKVCCARYSGTTYSTYIGMTEWATGNITYRFPGEYVRIVAAYSDDSTILPAAGSGIGRVNYLPTDRSLLIENKAADAKATGEKITKALTGVLDLDIEKGGWTNKGTKVNPSGFLGLRSGTMWSMVPGSVLTFFIDEGWTVTIKEGTTATKLDVTHDKSTDERIVIQKPFVVFQFNKFVDGEPVNLSVNDFVNSVIVHTSGVALNVEHNDVHDLPENQGQLNVVFRAYQMTKIMYEAQATLPRHAGGSKTVTIRDVPAGTSLTGITYSSMRETMAYVPQATNFDAFRTMIENPNSYIYTKHYEQGAPGYDYNSRCYVGAVCSSMVGYCYGIDDVMLTTVSFDTYPGFNALPAGQQNPYSLKLADSLNKSDDHIVIITDIVRNERGRIRLIEISEAAKPMCRTVYMTPEQIQSEYFDNGFVAYRYANIAEVSYTPSPWVHVDNIETGEPVYNTVLSPCKGEKSNWGVSETVEIDVMDNSEGYTNFIVKNRATSATVETGSIPSGNVIQIVGLAEGKYSAYLTDGTNNSDPVDFDVINANPEYIAMGNHTVRVNFAQATNRIPSAIYWCSNVQSSSDYKAERAFHIITAEEIEAGYAIIDEPQDMRASASVNGKWLMRTGYKTEYGHFASELEEVAVD